MCRHYLLRCPLLRYRTPGRAAALVAAALLTPLAGQVVINEIYYDPAPKTARHEFVEILNAGAGAVDVSGWRLTSGVDATAPVGTVLEPGAFVLFCEDVDAVASLFPPPAGRGSRREWGQSSHRNISPPIAPFAAVFVSIDGLRFGMWLRAALLPCGQPSFMAPLPPVERSGTLPRSGRRVRPRHRL